jgi:hypothetical protein
MTQHLPLTANAIIFLAAAVAVWFAGNGIANDADDVSDRTGLGKRIRWAGVAGHGNIAA